MAEFTFEGLPFDEAVTFFRQKVRMPTHTWTDLWQGMHARAFVVAGAMKDELLADFQTAITKGLEDGTTLADFRKDFDRIVAKHGWQYNGKRGWRSRVIFNTNMRTAYQAGRWNQIQRLKARRPWLRYSAVLDSRTRPEHRGWHGIVLSADDDWWNTYYPPNGWNCRCTVQQLSQRDLDRRGETPAPRGPEMPPVKKSVNTPDGPIIVEVPQGIDPGWSYNVGSSAWGRGAQSLKMEGHGDWTPLESAGGKPNLGPLTAVSPKAQLGPRAQDEPTLRQAMRDAIGADDKIFTDPAGGRVLVGEGIVDHILEDLKRLDGREAFFPFIPELVEDPAEIWVGFARSKDSGRVLIRRRYIQLFDMGKERVVTVVADAEDGYWAGLTFIRGKRAYVKSLRSGLRIYEK